MSGPRAGGREPPSTSSRMARKRQPSDSRQYDRNLGAALCPSLNLPGGGTVEETRQLLGHSSVSTTMIYTHELDRTASRSEGRIADMIFGAEPEAEHGAVGGSESGSGNGAEGGSDG